MLQRVRSASSPRPRGRGGAHTALALFAVALAVRLIAAPGTSGTPDPRTARIDEIARHVARGDGFMLDAVPTPRPTASVAPLAPWIAAMSERLGGGRPAFRLVVRAAIASLLPLLVVWLGSALVGVGVGRVAGVMCALDPVLVEGAGRHPTESLLAAALLIALGFSVNWLRTPRRARALGTGFAWGASALAGSAGLVVPAVVVAWAWVPLGLTLPPGDRLRQLALMALGLVVVIGPWMLRNTLVMHAPVPVTTSVGLALRAGNHDEVWSDPARRGGAIDVERTAPYSATLARAGEAAADAQAGDDGVRFAVSHAREWPAFAAARLERLWGARDGDVPDDERSGLPAGLILAATLILVPLAAWGTLRTLTGVRRWFQSIPVLVVLCFHAEAAVFFGAPRQRVAFEPLVVLLAAAGFDHLRRLVRTRLRGMRVIEGRRRSVIRQP
jgi:4-amino-4-deoxy-L-arabinose transferase-like glycosyltransferase